MNCYGKLPSEHLQYYVHDPQKNHHFQCLPLGHTARPGVRGFKEVLWVYENEKRFKCVAMMLAMHSVRAWLLHKKEAKIRALTYFTQIYFPVVVYFTKYTHSNDNVVPPEDA